MDQPADAQQPRSVKKDFMTPIRMKIPHGLICLKGGDLAQEISESGLPKDLGN
jgi:hypothetical protein